MEPKGKRITIKKIYFFEFYMPTPGWQVCLPPDVGGCPGAGTLGLALQQTPKNHPPLDCPSQLAHRPLKAGQSSGLRQASGEQREDWTGPEFDSYLGRNGKVGNSYFISQSSWTVWAPRLPIPGPELQIQGAGAGDSFLFRPVSPNLSQHWPRSETN